jgi:hypothetical protein
MKAVETPRARGMLNTAGSVVRGTSVGRTSYMATDQAAECRKKPNNQQLDWHDPSQCLGCFGTSSEVLSQRRRER